MGGGTRLFLLLVVIALAALGYRYWGFWQSGPATQAAPPAPPVTVAKPLVKDMEEWSDFTGQFEARESVEVRARVSGYLKSVNFTDGQLVKKGDLLFVIEPRPFELALETSKAQLAQTEAQLQLAQQQLDRTAQLRKNDYATKETYDERVSQVAIAAASRDAALAAVNQAQLNLDYTRVTAPVSGRMGRHEVSVGNLVMGGTTGTTTLLTTIVSLDPIWLVFNVSEGDGMTYKRLVQKGEVKSARDSVVEVQGQLMDEKEWTLKGAIDFVDNQYDRSSGTIRVRAAFANPNLFITPGQFGRVRVPMSQLRPDHARARRRGGNRPVGQAAVHGRPRRHGGAEAGRARSGDRRQFARHQEWHHRRRSSDHQWAVARAAGRQGHAGGGQDRSRWPAPPGASTP